MKTFYKIGWVIAFIFLVVAAFEYVKIRDYRERLANVDIEEAEMTMTIDSLKNEIKVLNIKLQQMENIWTKSDVGRLAYRVQKLQEENQQLKSELRGWKPTLTKHEQEILNTLLNNPDLTKLVKFKPTTPDRGWVCTSAQNVRFLSDDLVLVIAEDGLSAVALILKVTDPKDITKWQVQWQALLE